MDQTYWQRYIDQRAITEGCLEALRDEREARLAEVEVAAAEAAKTVALLQQKQELQTKEQMNRVAMHYRQMGGMAPRSGNKTRRRVYLKTPVSPKVTVPPTEPASPPSTFYASEMPSLWKPQCSELDGCSKNNFIPPPSTCFVSETETSLPTMLASSNRTLTDGQNQTHGKGSQSTIRRTIQDPRKNETDTGSQPTTATPALAPKYARTSVPTSATTGVVTPCTSSPVPHCSLSQELGQKETSVGAAVETQIKERVSGTETRTGTSTSLPGPGDISGCMFDDNLSDEEEVDALKEANKIEGDDDLPEAPSIAFRIDPVLVASIQKTDVTSHASDCSSCIDFSSSWVLTAASCHVFSRPDGSAAVTAMLHGGAVVKPVSKSSDWLQLPQGGWVNINSGWRLVTEPTTAPRRHEKKPSASPFQAFTNEWRKLQALQQTAGLG
eukprot:TRINITY_DN22053_c0_g1_i1.p1 TRINITY_DN22053_c0_g1~~TRINITY_DN22053_c0_g1_i1.p1  ORF type:complete len:440 (+),score=79.69 TRINITY_DN22053_c0_g1_i1:49-1368(+)